MNDVRESLAITAAKMRGLAYRIVLTIINIFFPPLAVMMLTGAGYDTMVNCFLFLLAVIPSHIHGFYISCTYFHRRHKVSAHCPTNRSQS